MTRARFERAARREAARRDTLMPDDAARQKWFAFADAEAAKSSTAKAAYGSQTQSLQAADELMGEYRRLAGGSEAAMARSEGWSPRVWMEPRWRVRPTCLTRWLRR